MIYAVFVLAAPILASSPSTAGPTAIGRWQPLEGQKVLDLAVVYGEEVQQLFNSTSWNPGVSNVSLIYPDLTYTIPYTTSLPAAALTACLSWSATSTASSITTMFLKFPNDATSCEVNPAVVATSGTMLQSTTTSATACTPDVMSASTPGMTAAVHPDWIKYPKDSQGVANPSSTPSSAVSGEASGPTSSSASSPSSVWAPTPKSSASTSSTTCPTPCATSPGGQCYVCN